MDDRHLDIVKNILKKYPYTFYAFGSRVRGTEKRLSDLDLCFIESIPGNIRSHIDEDFEDSDLPYKVDVVDWHACDKSFKSLIRNDLALIQMGDALRTLD
ncbi:MAG: nucleotidyltransferase domain-containing protein [Alphaproteobacteria bacterium]|nr:nucleotidyltransferase domain-containing protein [Alphaproteobacteria bacterium]